MTAGDPGWGYATTMSAVSFVVGLALIALTLRDGFETILLPRRVARRYQFVRIYYRNAWPLWSAMARRFGPGRRRALLGAFGPLSMVVLFAGWAALLIVGFALVHRGLGTPMSVAGYRLGLPELIYFSGVTFFTLGYGEITPTNNLGRFLALVEVGTGYIFLAVVIGYLPVLYQAFANREATISLLDARAGSPPTAGQLLVRLAPTKDIEVLRGFLAEWERWSAELLESHLSFPMLAFYRSQHDNQSWLTTLTFILDTSSLVVAGLEGFEPYRSRLTFAMARHAAVDLAQTLRAAPPETVPDRLPEERMDRLWDGLRAAGLPLRDPSAAGPKLAELRAMYEPFVAAMARYLQLDLPPIWPEETPVDNWQRSAWMKPTGGIGKLAPFEEFDDFDG
jgi:hypothetical protein